MAAALMAIGLALTSCGGPQPSALPSPLGGDPNSQQPGMSFAARAPADTRLLAHIDEDVVSRIADSPWLARQLAGYSLCNFKLRDRVQHLDFAVAAPGELRVELPGPMTVADVACLLGQPHGEGALRVGPFVVTPRPGGGVRITTPRVVEDGPGAVPALVKRFDALSASSSTVVVGMLDGAHGALTLELTKAQDFGMRLDLGDEERAKRAHAALTELLPALEGKAPALAGLTVMRDAAALIVTVPGRDVMELASQLTQHLVDTYENESPAMLPTVWTGDQLLLLKGATFDLGDVVVFRAPDGGDPLVGRIVARGGERVRVLGGRLSVDGREIRWDRKQEVYRRPDVPSGTAHAPVELWTERLGEREHEILLSPAGFGSPRDADERVREARLFVLGDYRDNTRDSRHFGAIAETAVLGKVVGVWASLDPLGHVRWERIGLSP